MKGSKRKVLKLLSLLLAILMSFVLLSTGCSGKNNTQQEPTKKTGTQDGTQTNTTAGTTVTEKKYANHVNLTWYLPWPASQPEYADVFKAANELIKEKINATVNFKIIEGGGDVYQQKMNILAAARDKFDLCFAAGTWAMVYSNNAQLGAFRAIDDLLPKFPKLKKSLPDYVWEAAKVKGKTYGVQFQENVTGRNGYVIQKRWVDKYNFNVSNVKKYTDIEPLLESIKKGEPEIVPLVTNKWGFFGTIAPILDFDGVASGVAYRFNGSDIKFINQYETPEYKEYLQVMRKWYTKGYINQDAATLANVNPLVQSGKIGVQFNTSLLASRVSGLSQFMAGNEAVIVPMGSGAILGTNKVIDALTCISATTKDDETAERSLALIELMHTDRDVLNTVQRGIQGKHWAYEGEKIKILDQKGYAWIAGYLFGDQSSRGPLLPLVSAINDPAIAAKDEAERALTRPSKILGFILDNTNITTEIANIKIVTDTYTPMLDTGTQDPEKVYPEFLEKLKAAGIDKVIAEIQTQVNAWLKTKK